MCCVAEKKGPNIHRENGALRGQLTTSGCSLIIRDYRSCGPYCSKKKTLMTKKVTSLVCMLQLPAQFLASEFRLLNAMKNKRLCWSAHIQHTGDAHWINNWLKSWNAAYLLFPLPPSPHKCALLNFQLQWEWRKIGGENWKFGLKCRQPWLSARRPVTSPRTTLCMAE